MTLRSTQFLNACNKFKLFKKFGRIETNPNITIRNNPKIKSLFNEHETRNMNEKKNPKSVYLQRFPFPPSYNTKN